MMKSYLLAASIMAISVGTSAAADVKRMAYCAVYLKALGNPTTSNASKEQQQMAINYAGKLAIELEKTEGDGRAQLLQDAKTSVDADVASLNKDQAKVKDYVVKTSTECRQILTDLKLL